jgi:hypothetical protein
MGRSSRSYENKEATTMLAVVKLMRKRREKVKLKKVLKFITLTTQIRARESMRKRISTNYRRAEIINHSM